MIPLRLIQLDAHHSVGVRSAPGGGILLKVEDPVAVAIVEMSPEFVAQLAAAIAPAIPAVEPAVLDLASVAARPAEGILVSDGAGQGYPDRVLLTVEERDALVAAAAAAAEPPGAGEHSYFLYPSHEKAEEAIQVVMACLPAVIAGMMIEEHQRWLDGRPSVDGEAFAPYFNAKLMELFDRRSTDGRLTLPNVSLSRPDIELCIRGLAGLVASPAVEELIRKLEAVRGA